MWGTHAAVTSGAASRVRLGLQRRGEGYAAVDRVEEEEEHEVRET